MKKLLLYAFMICAGMQVTRSQVLFDPDTVHTAYLPSGMSIVTVDGQKVLQVVLKGWNSQFNLPSVVLGSNQVLKASYFKYRMCQATDDTLDKANINGFVQINDTVNKVHPSWAPTTLVPATFSVGLSPISDVEGPVSGTIPSTVKIAHQIQFAGQENKKYGATTGDTIWVGKVRAYTNDPTKLMIPSEVGLKSNWSVVKIDGVDYLKIVTNGWNDIINLDEPVTLKAGTTMSANFNFSIGAASDDTLDKADINGMFQVIDTINKVTVSWSTSKVPATFGIGQQPVTGVLGKVSSEISSDIKIIHQVQFFGQEKKKYGATTGDTIWISEITLTEKPVGPGAGINKINNVLGIYPTIANDKITVNHAGENIMIFDATGKVVLNIKNAQENAEINISSLKSGLYIVRNVKDGASSSSKFIKK